MPGEFKIEPRLRRLLTPADLSEWAGSTAAAVTDHLAAADREIDKLQVILRELAERNGIAPAAMYDPDL